MALIELEVNPFFLSRSISANSWTVAGPRVGVREVDEIMSESRSSDGEVAPHSHIASQFFTHATFTLSFPHAEKCSNDDAMKCLLLSVYSCRHIIAGDEK